MKKLIFAFAIAALLAAPFHGAVASEACCGSPECCASGGGCCE